ncbi:VCBS repeat-containing protein [Balamuthia mandrillaris]
MPAPRPFFLCLSLLCSSLLFFPAPARGQTFQAVDRGTAFPDGAPVFMGSGGSMTWVDVDQDGLLDVFFLGTHRPMFTRVSLLFHNDGNWTFSEITHQAFPDGSLPNGIIGKARWADFNQDGFPDLLVFSSESSSEQFVKVWKNNQGANFTEVTTELLPALSVCQSSWCWLEWGDFDGDDLVDLFLSVRNDAKTVFLNDGNEPTTFTTEVDVTSAFSGAYHSYVGEVRVVDFDGDGDDDIFWVMNSAVKLYRSNGDGSFTDATNSLIAEGSPSLPALHEGSADWGMSTGINAWTSWSVVGLALHTPRSMYKRRKGSSGLPPRSSSPEDSCRRCLPVPPGLWTLMGMFFWTWPSPGMVTTLFNAEDCLETVGLGLKT